MKLKRTTWFWIQRANKQQMDECEVKYWSSLLFCNDICIFRQVRLSVVNNIAFYQCDVISRAFIVIFYSPSDVSVKVQLQTSLFLCVVLFCQSSTPTSLNIILVLFVSSSPFLRVFRSSWKFFPFISDLSVEMQKKKKIDTRKETTKRFFTNIESYWENEY